MGKKVLIVYAHPEKKSFNSALLNSAVTSLTSQGHQVRVSDLYAEGFNPIIGREDIKDNNADPGEHFDYCEMTGQAWSDGRLSDDIQEELAKLSWADLVIFQFPMQWSSVPAILKGWFDRVLVMRYAFTETNMFDAGNMKGKKVVLSFTTGVPESFYKETGPHGDMNVVLWSIQNNVLRFVGFDVLAPNIIYGPGLPNTNHEARVQHLRDWEERLKKIWDEEPLFFLPLSVYKPVDEMDPVKGVEVDEDKLDDVQVFNSNRSKISRRLSGPTIGQHLGLGFPKDSMIMPTKNE
ncbi:hypothetical protein CAPTEDRAFT_154919 [Capitella teleta]|uniref:Flavodoxin-like fold domain-containing protein n=1 Tax=Capitella teleta TaxID=283909 RepID=R7T6S4_CAPTE|nr:hypothetical protein CAPTEDRAFT_154919 [Capitella teleta]|eukprot:ELT87075.1 hypothetical protein CAPTEDRAFT_154919 [Capitella teleta]